MGGVQLCKAFSHVRCPVIGIVQLREMSSNVRYLVM